MEKNLQKFMPALVKGIKSYDLISDGDTIAVGLSGGKDSLFLLETLAYLNKYIMKNFKLIALHVDQTGGKNDLTDLKEFCSNLSVPLFTTQTNIFEVVFDIRKEKNPCALCSKMRRGALLECAKKHGANKVALGHHADDFIQTFLLSLLYEGRLSVYKPKTYMSRTDMTVIRPLMFIWEKEITARASNMKILKNTCKANKNTKREEAKHLLDQMRKLNPDADKLIFSALTNPERNNLI